MNGYRYGDKNTYIFDNRYPNTGIKESVTFEVESAENLDGKIITQQITKGDIKEVEQNYYYYYKISSYQKIGTLDSVYNMLTQGDYWLANHCGKMYVGAYALGIRRVDNQYNVSGYNMFDSNGYVYSYGLSVAPVVSLKNNIKVKGGDASGWELDI